MKLNQIDWSEKDKTGRSRARGDINTATDLQLTQELWNYFVTAAQ